MEGNPHGRDSFSQSLSTSEIQEHEFLNTIDGTLEDFWDGVPFNMMDVIHNESSHMDSHWSDSTHDQNYIQSYNLFAEDPAFSHADESFVQPKSPKVDKIVASRKSASTLACAWPDCRVSAKRKTDLIRHINTRHFPAHSFPCKFNGCNRNFYRKDKLQEHERHSHHSEVLFSLTDTSKKTIQATNDALALPDESIFLSTKDVLDESGSRSSRLWELGIQDFDLEPRRSTPTTEGSVGPSEDLSHTSDGLSRKCSISSKSTSSYRNVSNRNRSELRSASQARENDQCRRRFACPFRKHNRQEYDIHKHKTCAISEYATVHRLKEHLYRCHRAPPQCRRCWTIFADQRRLDHHLSTTEKCKIHAGSPAEGISPEIEMQIKVRRRGYFDRSEEDKWKEIYSLLFPLEQVPSPFFDPIEDVAPTENIDSREASVFELNELKSKNPPDFEDLASYVREELPGLINLQLEATFGREGAPALDGPQRSKLLSIVTECHDLIVRKYQERVGGGEDAGSLSTG